MKDYLILRTPSGISGDMLVTGLFKIGGFSAESLDRWVSDIGLSELRRALKIEKKNIRGISGWQAEVRFKESHHHRKLHDVLRIIAKSRLTRNAKKMARGAFKLLARVEARVHGISLKEVTFHEIGGLDSILDVCLGAALFDKLSPARFYCSPLPVCDGKILCDHGILQSPAPAVLSLLEGLPVYGIDSCGETVTPTALALLKIFGARFGKWPAVTVQKSVRAFGSRIIPRVRNGAIFVVGNPGS